MSYRQSRIQRVIEDSYREGRGRATLKDYLILVAIGIALIGFSIAGVLLGLVAP